VASRVWNGSLNRAFRRRNRHRDLIGGSHLQGSYAYIAIAGLLIYTGSFAIGLGPVFWLLISVVIVSFLTLLSAIGNAGTFFLFAGLSIVALAYFQRQVPETKNRSLQDIERDLDLPERGDDQHPRLAGRTGL